MPFVTVQIAYLVKINKYLVDGRANDAFVNFVQ